MDGHNRTTKSPDGRTLMFAEWGDLSGRPLIALHGTPGCRLDRHPNEELIRSTGAHLVTYDRPGYGGSDRQAGRCIADCAADVAAIADTVGFDEFAISGGSGGGAHALAVAALLSSRVTRAACVVGVAPYDVLGDAFTEGMDPENVKEFGWALEGEDRLALELTREDAAMRKRAAADPKTILGDFNLPDSDRAVLARPDFAKLIRDSTQEATRTGVWGWVDDDLAHTRPWRFDLASIRVPVAIWYGLADVLVPAAHGAWLARNVPGAVARIQSSGHLSDPDRRVVELNGWLLDGRPWD